MKSNNYSFTESQIEWIRDESKATGLNASEIVRRAIDTYRGVKIMAEIREAEQAKKLIENATRKDEK